VGWLPLIESLLVVAPLEQHLERLHVVGLVRVAGVLLSEVVDERVGVVMRDGADVSLLAEPDPAVEEVHPVTPALDGGLGVPVVRLGVFPPLEEPGKAGLSLVAIVGELAGVEHLLGRAGDDADVVEVSHFPARTRWNIPLSLGCP
jgi:hypothetical protein